MGRRAHRLLLAAPRVSKRNPRLPPVMVLVGAGGFPACLGWRCGLQSSAISREELSEQWIRKGVKSWTANPKQQPCKVPWVTLGVPGAYTSTSPPRSSSCTLAAALTPQYCLWERPSKAIPSVQPCPLLRLQETFFFGSVSQCKQRLIPH